MKSFDEVSAQNSESFLGPWVPWMPGAKHFWPRIVPDVANQGTFNSNSAMGRYVPQCAIGCHPRSVHRHLSLIDIITPTTSTCFSKPAPRSIDPKLTMLLSSDGLLTSPSTTPTFAHISNGVGRGMRNVAGHRPSSIFVLAAAANWPIKRILPVPRRPAVASMEVPFAQLRLDLAGC